MKPQQTPCSISKVIGLSNHVIDFIKGPTQVENAPELIDNIRGGVLSDIRFSWLTNRARLEVLHTKTGQKVAAWSFRDVLSNIAVSCVVDVSSQNGKAPYLVVGLEHWSSPKDECGTVCVFDVSSSRVLRAIHFDDRVTSVHVISVSSDASLPGALRALDGVIAVGTKNGKILLVDLCRQACDEAAAANVNDSECVRDEYNPCQLLRITMQDVKSLEHYKEMALQSCDHLCLQLNELCTDTDVVILKTPKGGHKIHVNKEEVTISALQYCPQLGSLLVGYNFGAFQLYNLLTVRLEYTSPVYEDCTPVTHFAVQEPCDDPRAFCYVWVMYSAEKAGVPGYPMAVMYALAYNTKEFLEGYGHLYQELVSCSVRFQTDLMSLPGSKLTNPVGARCVSVRAHTRTIVNKLADVQEEHLALCTVVWTVQDQNTTTETYLCLFDLNQWYKEQMPSSPRPDDSASYMVYVSLTELFRPATDYNGPLLDARLDTASLNQFMCAQRLEEHYFPSALAFRSVCVREEDIVWFGSPGAQRHLLSCIELAGPLCLMRPTDIFHQCISLGLTPLYTDVPYNINTPLNVQREMVLSVCLEQQLVCWLCRCAVDWSNGSQASAGCTLDFLLKWAWQRADTLKHSANKLCVPLFDYSGMRLDANALIQLNHCTCQLKHLATLFTTVMNSCTTFLSNQDIGEIEHQLRMLRMLAVYFEVLQWLLNVGLLPECHLTMYPRMDESERISAPYPGETLERFYQTRRTELRELQDQKHRASDSCDLLFIDNLIDLECGGVRLRKQWESDGGRGLYPPPSLQALLRTYLVEDIDIVHKHCLFIYVFLDLAMTLDQSRYKPIITHLIKFPAVFKLSPSIIKITQAFWQLDHGDFSTAMAQLLDTSVSSKDLKPWHHRTVLKSLLLQGQTQHALLYQQVRKPPTSNIQDMCIVTTLLVVNDMLQEAFHFQRQNRTIYNERELLKHFFQVSDQTEQLAAIIQLPLCPVEETEFMKYLKANQSEDAKNLLVIYYLQRDRYGEAFDMNDRLNNNEIAKQGLLGQRERNFRNVIVQGFKKTLPSVTQTLLDYCKNHREKYSVRVSGRRPVPMSVLIHDTKQQATYKSTLIQTSLMKAKEIWIQRTEQDNSTTDNLNETPFISTPKVLPADKKTHATPVIYPAIVYPVDISQFVNDLEDEPTPAKKMRLSPRQTMRASGLNDEHTGQLDQFRRRLSCVDSISLLDTPIVKRKTYRSTSRETDQFSVGTPTSILKVRSLLRNSISPDAHDSLRGNSTTPEQLDDNGMDTDNGVPAWDTSTASVIKSVSMNLLGHARQAQRKSSLGVSPRKPIQRTPRPAVRFEDARYSPTETMEVEIPVISLNREKTPDRQSTSFNVGSKESSRSTEETFYSPNTSFSDTNTAQQQPQEIEPEEPLTPRRSALKRKAADSGSVKSRRSYKSNVTITESPARALRSRSSLGASPSLDTTRTTRSTPRKSTLYLQEDSTSETINIPVELVDNNTVTNEDNQVDNQNDLNATKSNKSTPLLEARRSTNQHDARTSTSNVTSNAIFEQEPAKSSSKTDSFPKLAGRRSLARQVLEQNTLAKALSTPRVRTRYSSTQLNTPPGQTVGIEMSSSKSTTTIITKSTGNVTEESVSRSTSELKDTYSSERNPSTAAHVIKHVHNESSSRSNVHRVTEILDTMDNTNYTPDESMNSVNILSSDSDVSESFLSRYVTGSQPKQTTVPRDSFLEEEFAAGMPVCESTVCEVEEVPAAAAGNEPSERAIEQLMQQRNQPDETVLVDITSISVDADDSEYQTMDVDVGQESTRASSPPPGTSVNKQQQQPQQPPSTLAVETTRSITRPASPAIRGRNSIRESSPFTKTPSPFTRNNEPALTITKQVEVTEVHYEANPLVEPQLEIDEEKTSGQSDEEQEEVMVVEEQCADEGEHSSDGQSSKISEEEECQDTEELRQGEQESAEQDNDDDDDSGDGEDIEVNVEIDEESDRDDSSIEEKLSNLDDDDDDDEEEDNEEEEENLYEENVEQLNVEDDADSDQTSNQSSDVIEIKSSSSDESLEQNVQVDEMSEEEEEEEAEDDESMDALEMNIVDADFVQVDIMEMLSNNLPPKDVTTKRIFSQKVTSKQVTDKAAEKTTRTEQIQSSSQPSTHRITTENATSSRENSSEKITENVATVAERAVSEDNTTNCATVSVHTADNVDIPGTTATVAATTTVVVEPDIATETVEVEIVDVAAADVIIEPADVAGPGVIVETAGTEHMETESMDSNASTIPYIPKADSNAVTVDSEETTALPKPARRMSTRRRSTLTESGEQTVEEPVTPARYSLRGKSVDKQIEMDGDKQKRSRRASSVQSTEEPPSTAASGIARRTRRAASVDTTPLTAVAESEVVVKPVRTRRGSSVDPESRVTNKPETTPAPRGGRRRRSSSVQAEVIIEERTPDDTALEQIQEKIDEYSATHRLTRHQKAMMEKSMEVQQMKMLHQKPAPPVGNMDPMKLMDKETFSGEPDTEERHLRQLSPASSVDTQSSVATRSSARLRNKHHHSPGSDTADTPATPKRKRGRPSTTSTAPSVDSPTSQSAGRPRRRSFTLAQQTITTPTRRSRRLTSQDTDISETSSVMSVPVVPIVELQRLPAEMLRHRSLSPTMLKEEKDAAVLSSPRTNRKSTRTSIAPLRRELSKISEEAGSNSDLVNTKDTESMGTIEEESKPRGRPRKSVLKDATQSPGTSAQDHQPPGQRVSACKPPVRYLPTYTAFKSRKSFKVVHRIIRRNSTQE